MSEKIKVFVRVRNMQKNEMKDMSHQKWFIKDNLLHQKLDDERSLSYLCYDSVFHEETNQSVFDKCIKENVEMLFEGKSLTVFAYGQTGSGKTYTMSGEKRDPGIIVQVLREIFKKTDGFSEAQISYFEIYNENIVDLINPKNNPKVYFFNEQVIVKGLDRKDVLDLESAIGLIEECEKKRKIGQTSFNLRSSRSHTIFKFDIKIKKSTVTVTLIDLAGSEKASGSVLRVKEGVFINKSLLALGKVITSLHKKEFTSYRDSKLTRVLQSSMTGNVNLIALCMISPNVSCVDESVSTLNFASRLCQIEMKYQINKKSEPQDDNHLCVNCRNNFELDKKKKLTVTEYSDSSSVDSSSNSSNEIDFYEKYLKLQEKRIANLESLIISLLKKTPSLKEKEIFTLEKNMYNLQIDILKRKKPESS